MKALCRDCLWTGEARPARCPVCASPRLIGHAEMETLSIAHLDCDAFYASVEKRDDPSLRDKPVIVGGGKRGVVTTACYIARMSGPRSAMPMFKALKLCPNAVVIKPDFAKYKLASRQIMAKLEALTPKVQTLSLDEAWIDLSGTARLHGAPPAYLLARIQKEIEAEVGITVSIGLSANKFLAKIASELDKPRGFSMIGAGEAQAMLAPRPVSVIPGVGPAFVKSLEAAGYRTVGDLVKAGPKALAERFGANGLRLSQLAEGRDNRPVNPDQVRKGISCENTFEHDLSRVDELEAELHPLCERVARQARAGGVAGRVATLKLRTPDFRILTRRRTLPSATQTAHTLFAAVREMLSAEADGRSFRLIGAGLTDLIDADSVEADFFSGEHRRLKGEKAVDSLRDKFGAAAVVSGRSIGAAKARAPKKTITNAP
jgi:DNA polymerase-4